MEFKASLKFARVGCQKARLVADLIRGKSVEEALKSLVFLNKKSGLMFKKLIESAVANAEYQKTRDVDTLVLKSIWVDQGPVLKRFRPRAQGRAYGVRKKTSHLNVVLAER